MALDRNSVVRRLETIGIVTLITLLIWLWAETESLTTLPVVTRVQLVVSSGGGVGAEAVEGAKFVEPEEWDGMLRIVVGGSDRGVQQAARVLGQPVRLSLAGLGVPSGGAAGAGEYVADMRTVVEKLADLKQWGVTIVEVEPATVRVRVSGKEPRP